MKKNPECAMALYALNNIRNKVTFGKSLFLKSIFSAGIISGLKLFNGILIVKALAIINGVEGMPEGGDYINITQIAQILSTAGISMGIIKYLSQHQRLSNAYHDYLSAAFFITLIFSAISAFALIVLSPVLSLQFFNTQKYFYYFIFIGISTIFFGLNNFLVSYYNGIQNLKNYLSINAINSVAGLILILITIYFKNKHLLFISIAFYQSIGFLAIGFKRIWEIYKNEIKGRWSGSFASLKGFSGFSLYTLQNIALIGLGQIFVRSILIEKYGTTQAGLWDGMMRISSSYLNVFILVLSIFFIPSFSSATFREAVATIYKKGTLLVGALIITLSAIFLFKNFFLRIVLSNEFSDISSIMPTFFIGDIFRYSGYIISIFFLSRGRIIITALSDFLFNGIFYCLFNYIFIQHSGIRGSGYAYLINFILYFLFLFAILLWHMKKQKNQTDGVIQ